MISQAVSPADASMFAMQIHAHRGTAVYGAYLVEPDQMDAVSAELVDELTALDSSVVGAPLRPRGGPQLVRALAGHAAEVLLVDARAFAADDWALLDRRRSSLAHRGVLVFITSSASNELRCHLHPGSDDISIPAPLMSPREILWLFTHGLRWPADRKQRNPTAFEVAWFAETLTRIPPE